MPLLKKCSKRGCNKILKDTNEIYCDRHKETKKKEYRSYKQHRKDKQEQTFYSSNEWLEFRDLITIKQNAIDVVEYILYNNIVPAETYHHIVELKEDWSRRIDINNVIGLSYSNHNKVHKRYNKSLKDKKLLQDNLFKILDQYYKSLK